MHLKIQTDTDRARKRIEFDENEHKSSIGYIGTQNLFFLLFKKVMCDHSFVQTQQKT